jgi:hypothetical protein
MIPELVAQYVDFTMAVKNSQTLGESMKSQIMLQMAQALNVLVPLAGGQQDQVVQQQHEMDLDKQKHAQDMQIQLEKHQADLAKADQKHQMDLAHQEQKHQLAQAMAEQKAKQAKPSKSE